MKSRSLTEIIDDMKSVLLANRLLFDYSPPEEKKDYISVENEAALIKKFNLPTGNQDLTLSLINAWPTWVEANQTAETLASEPFTEPQMFIKRMQFLLTNFAVSNKYLLADAEEGEQNLTAEGGVASLCKQANNLNKHLELFLSYLKFMHEDRKNDDAKSVPKEVEAQYMAFHERELKTYAEFGVALKALSGMLSAENKVDLQKFKEWFFLTNNLQGAVGSVQGTVNNQASNNTPRN